MEKDRFENNSKLYILGMISLVLSLGFFFFSLYILPYLIWSLNYNVPLIILSLLASLQEDYNYGVVASKTIVWLIFFLPSLITGTVSYFASNYMDKQLNITPQSEENFQNPPSKKLGKELKDSASFGLKILGLMILIIILIFLLQFFIQSTV